MKSYNVKSNGIQFLSFYCLYCFVVTLVCYISSLVYPLRIYDELMVILIPPFAYAALFYPRYIYFLAFLIGNGFAVLTILSTNTNIPRSLVTLTFVSSMELIVLEFLYRNSCTQRKLIKENVEINNELERTNTKLNETFNKLVRISEILPMCQVCNKLRTDETSWHEFEQVLQDELHTDIVKGICEDCANELVTELTNTDETPQLDVSEKL